MTKEPRSRAGHEKRPGRAGRDLPLADDTPIIHGVIPPRDVLLRFISEHPEQASKREIAKAFGLKGEARVELKALLKSLPCSILALMISAALEAVSAVRRPQRSLRCLLSASILFS